ncbi:uncharacterized protein EI90DRAFT_2904762 [Cantharellus anzutake]|uniref:uncharacterized protein n=1 Tax=Cantharellus anzutake TaxID=1750568 RepID=UPI0019060222|nr:uncharacterized protein EI90DRAFT_2904762 [Cantharellus anzutake]KAF8341999.1 hypothetical protein EI90DRAFT_2904762 [Cantharellus anzutake]
MISTATFRASRPPIVGPDVPKPPFPIRLQGYIQRGFGRGGRDLGCHTANLPDDALEPITSATEAGIYYGYAQVSNQHQGPEQKGSLGEEDLKVLPMVMSLGRNPYYGNKKTSAEVHIIHKYPTDFYGHYLAVVVLGYIRPELDYTSRESLIEDIQTDIKVALNSLDRPEYSKYSHKPLIDSSSPE